MSKTTIRLPFIRPETHEPPMSDRGALDILCGLLGGTVSLYEDSEQIKAAIETACQALEDRILLEDDGK